MKSSIKSIHVKPKTTIIVSLVITSVGMSFYLLGWNTLFAGWVFLLLSLIIYQLFELIRNISKPESFPPSIEQLLSLARDPEIADIHRDLSSALEKIAESNDPLFRELVLGRLQTVVQRTQAMAELTIEYTSTESWRVAYEKLLRSPGLHLYRSVSHIESVHYWQDGPGQQSTRLNLELQDDRTICVERIAIIADHLWPKDSPFPATPIHSWLNEQHCHGIWVRLVRESALIGETSLLTDFGIYGNRAMGIQESDSAGRTTRFVLNFDFNRVERAEENWDRLIVYSISYRELLDRQA